jgi:succinate dehydrogenase / fumarate reductase membrane anchor subunit
MSLRTPLARVRGLGAAKEGVTHWWMQRVTALALIPLTVWFAYSVAMLGKLDHETLVTWIRSPTVTVLLILLTVVGLYHMQLGLRVILEDYIHSGWLKLGAIIVTNFTSVGLMVASVLTVLRIALETPK